MSFIKQDMKDYNLPFSTPDHHKGMQLGSVQRGVEQGNYSQGETQKYRFPPSSGLSHQSKLQKMNSCYFQENISEKENKPHLVSSATTSQQEIKKSQSRITTPQAIPYNGNNGKQNNQSQNKMEGSQYYLPPSSSIMVGSDNKDHYKRYIDFSQNSMQLNNPSSTANSSQMNNSQSKQNNQNDSLQQNQCETVKVKQYLMSQQNSLKKDSHQPVLLSHRDSNFQAIKRNILGDILNNQHQAHEITSKKITSSTATTPRNGSTTPNHTFKCDQFNESLNRIQKLKDKYSYVDIKSSGSAINQSEENQSQQAVQNQFHLQNIQSEGMLTKHLMARTAQSSTQNLLFPLESNTNYHSGAQGNSRGSFVDSEVHSHKVLDRVQSTKNYHDSQTNVSILQRQDSAFPSRGQSPFSQRQYDQSNNTDPNRQYKVEVQKYKQYFIESAVESERLSREQENLKDENEKLRFRLRELLRISQIQTGNLHAKHSNQITPTSMHQESRDTFPRDTSMEKISSHSSLQKQEKQNQNLEKKRGKSQYVENEQLNMKKELEECVLLLESGRQKIDSLKYSINEKEQLIKQTKDYTSSLENRIRSLERENTELKNTIESMKNKKSQNLNLIEQICNDGYQEHLKEQILAQFNFKFVEFLEGQKKLILELTKENIENMEDVGFTVFKLSQTLESGQQKSQKQDQSAYRIQLIRYAKDEINKLKQLMMKKLNLTDDMIIVESDSNLDKYLIDKPNLSTTKKSNLCMNCANNENEMKSGGHSKNQDSFQLYLAKNTGKDSLNLSLTSISETKNSNNISNNNNNKQQIINCNAANQQNNQKITSLCEDQDMLQMILLQAQALEHVFKEQQYS